MIESSSPSHSQPIKILLAMVTSTLALLLLAYSYLMFQWPMLRESHFLHYIAYLVNEHGFVPYRDVLETSWFGTFLFHMAIGKLLGYSGSAFRIADLLYLALLLLVTWKILRHLDYWLAWIGSLSFGLAYLHYGGANSLQRDYVLLLPVAISLLLALQTQWPYRWRSFLIGMCFGGVVSIKPHAVIGLPVILVLLYSQSAAGRSSWRILFYCGLGGTIVFGAGLLWLWLCGGLTAFIDMALHYLPLYQSFNGAHQITTPTERWQNTQHWWKYFLWIWPYSVATGLIFGWFNTNRQSQQRALLLALIALTVCYNLYPLLAGKFWDYHWIPYTYFAVLSTSALLLPTRNRTWGNTALSASMVLYFLFALSSQYLPWQGFNDQLRRYPDLSIDNRFDNEVADFIRQHLKPGDTIQIIEQGGPATIYLLKAEAVLATPYLGSFMFLHHTDEPYVQHAQQDFLQRLQQKPPALFLVMTDFTRPSGPGTITDIPGLKNFLQTHYQPLWKTPGFTFWQYSTEKIMPTGLPAELTPTPGSVQPSPP